MAPSTLPRLRWPLLALGLAALVLLWQRAELWQAQLSAISPVPKAAMDLDASLRADLSASALQRAAASRALAKALRDSGLFEHVQNGETEAWAEVGTWLVDHRYALSPAVDPQRFSAAGLRAGINETLSLLGTPGGNAIKPLLERDPTGETVRIAESRRCRPRA